MSLEPEQAGHHWYQTAYQDIRGTATHCRYHTLSSHNVDDVGVVLTLEAGSATRRILLPENSMVAEHLLQFYGSYLL